MREENGNSPKNARIKIDYSKTKPNVTFSYPSKEHQFEGSMYSWIALGWFLLNIPVLINYMPIMEEIQSKNKYINEVNLSNYNLSSYESFLYYVNDTKLLENTFNAMNKDKSESIKENLKELIYPLGFIIYIFLFPYLIIYLPFKKKWQRIYPKFQGYIGKKKITTLKPKDIKQENNKYYCELPIFSNIILDYKATKDFSKYLEMFEIREHNFKYHYKKSKRKLNKKSKDRRKRKEINEWLWYARFYFKQKPIKGNIKILYK